MMTNLNDSSAVMETNLDLPLVARGKVRDIYSVCEDKLLIVTSDRLSAFDVILPNPIPLKGKVLTQISAFWFDYFKDEVNHHLISTDIHQMGLPQAILDEHGASLDGRSMLVKKTKPLTIECVVRGYVTGSGWKDYQKTGAICGHELPENLKQCAKLETPIFTPATKAETGHDENISREQAAEREGKENAEKAEELSISIYKKGRELAASKGIIIADTKFEFGMSSGEMILIDEVLTPDSSRFWPGDKYEEGRDQESYDKQIVRNYLEEIKWNKQAPAPELPAAVAQKTSQAYLEVYERLTGKKL